MLRALDPFPSAGHTLTGCCRLSAFSFGQGPKHRAPGSSPHASQQRPLRGTWTLQGLRFRSAVQLCSDFPKSLDMPGHICLIGSWFWVCVQGQQALRQTLCPFVRQEMYDIGVAPDVGHFNSAILACENSDKFTPAAMFLFESMLAQGVMPNIATVTTLTSCYSAAPLEDVLSVGSQVKTLGLKADSAFAEAYVCAILGLPRHKRMYGRTLTTFAKTLERLSSARKAAARQAISELRADGVKLPRFCTCGLNSANPAFRTRGFPPFPAVDCFLANSPCLRSDCGRKALLPWCSTEGCHQDMAQSRRLMSDIMT